MVAINYFLAGDFILIILVFIFVFIVLQLRNKRKQIGNIQLQSEITPPLLSTPPVISEPLDPHVAQLREVITARLAAGYTKEQLYEALRDKGWNTTTLDKAFKGF